ncbi:MAG: peptidoglycan DD-metalloendopeptidase family protein [Ignavibacteriaceae bacterium]|nr:peptidoglycan DD-metalloendopeptidase family protein [Ignavibacteriaceae bacterium]
MQLKKYLYNLKELKGYSILVVPDDTGREARTHKLSMRKIYLLVIGYTVIAMLLGFILFNITPLGLMIFPKYANLTSSDLQKIETLNERMLFLSRELENLKSTNEQLRHAIMLGDSTLLDSLKNKDESTKKNKLPAGGNLLAVFRHLFLFDFSSPDNLYFYPPATGFISRPFNPDKGHMGTDYVLKAGTPVYASANGYVLFSGFTSNDGYMLMISHPGGFVTVYKHCSVLIKKSRDDVIQGEIIALSGNSGKITTGPHLHFEIWKDGFPVNPEKYLLKY